MSIKPTYEELEKRNKELEKEAVKLKRLEVDFRENDEKCRKYEAYMDAMGDTLIVMNMQRKVIDLNKSALQLLGYKEEEIPHLCFETIFPEKEHAKHYAEMKMALETGTVRPFETLLFTKDEEEVPVLISGTLLRDARNEPIGFVGVCKDITARKQAEEALRESEEKYRSMMEAMNDAIYICSSDYRVMYMNPAMIRRIGREAIGEPCHKVINDLDEICPFCVHDKIQQGEHYRTEIVSPRDGRFFHVSHSPIFHADGSISKMSIYHDQTERKQAEEVLQQRTHDLGKRVKELNCLYGISNLVEKRDISLNEIFQGVVEIVPSSWQYPEITCSRIILEDDKYRSKGFKETVWNSPRKYLCMENQLEI